jgi:7-cyano-7-deazaguanine synthase in queuosine biosynthesis
MRRFVFVGRLGAADTAPVPVVQSDAVQVAIQFVAAFERIDYGIGDALEMLRRLGGQPSEMAIDFLFVAAMINAADTRVSRRINAQDGWTREIDIVVPVSNPALWISQTDLLSRTLRFLTGDRWRIFFRERPKAFATIAKPPTNLALLKFDDVCLFSGGLDSLVGAINILAAGRRPLLVSHYWDSETSKAQNALLGILKHKYSATELRSLRVRLGFDKNHADTGEIENSLRARSFLFFALAVLAASALGGNRQVTVPENGLIGLNVPLDPLRLGALSTRTTHPFYMARMNELLGALGIPVELMNPFRHQTKGEMVAGCGDLAFLRTLTKHSMSCSSPAKARYKGLAPQHCGTCVPCLIRRASLAAGLGTPDDTQYAVPSLTGHTLDTTAAEGEHVRSFQLVIERLRVNPRAASALVRIPGPLNDAPNEVDDYVDVFVRGMQEVGSLLALVKAKPI